MKKLYIALTFVLLTLLASGASAADGVQIQAQYDTASMAVELEVSGFSPYARVSLVASPSTVLSPEEAFADFNSKTAYAGQLLCSADGKLSTRVSFLPEFESGEYVFFVTDPAKGKTYTSEAFSYINATRALEALREVNRASSQNIDGIIRVYASDLLLDLSEYSQNGNHKAICTMLINMRPREGFEDVYDLHNTFCSCVLSTCITDSADASVLCDKYLKYTQGSDKYYLPLSAQAKSKVHRLLAAKGYSSPSELASYLPEACFGAKISCASTAGELKDYFLMEYADELNLDLSAYKKLSNTTKVFAELLDTEFEGYDDARDKFYDVVKSLKSESGETSKGGSGGGGGGIASSPQVTPPAVTLPPQTPQTGSAYYNDLADALWAVESIEYLTDKGVVSGDGTGAFRPSDTVSRAEFVKMLSLAFGISPADGVSPFADVTQTDWYAPYVMAATEAGIVNGMGDGTFGAGLSVTREDMSVICVRALSYVGADDGYVQGAEPTDINAVSDYAKESVLTLYASGVISGNPDGSFAPKMSATRAQASKIIAQLMKSREV